MSNFGDLIGTLHEQFGPLGMVSLLFGLVAIFGALLGASLMGIFASARKRRIYRQAARERDELRDSLHNSQSNEKRVEAVRDILNAKYSGVEELLKHQETHIETLSEKLTEAENIARESEAARAKLAKREDAWLATMRANEHQQQPPPTLTRRVSSDTESELASDGASESAIGGESDVESLATVTEGEQIPDDQIIPVIAEADLTANIEDYDLSDIEDVIGQDV